MRTIREVFGKRYEFDYSRKDPESFRDFVISQTTQANLARSLGLSKSVIGRKFERPIILMKCISEHPDCLIETRSDLLNKREVIKGDISDKNA